MKATTRKAIADVTRRKGRSILVIIGIMIGVLGLTAVNVAGNAITTAFAYANDQSKTANIQFYVQAIDPSMAATLANQPNVKQVQIATVYQSRWQTNSASRHVPLQISAYPDLQHIALSPFQLSSGRYPGQGEIVMESSDNTLQHVAIGDTVSINTQSGTVALRVVGLVRTLGQPSASFASTAFAYMSVAALQQATGVHTANVVQVQVHTPQQQNQTARDLATWLHSRHVAVLSVTVGKDNSGQVLVSGLLSVMSIVAIIALILTCFLIINTISTLITEQTKIIGTLKAIGGTQGSIMRGYLTSVGIYGLVGSILGVGLGVGVGYLLATFLATVVVLDLGAFQLPIFPILIGLAVGLGAPLIAALIPLWTGTRMTVRQAMAAYGISSGRKTQSTWGRHLPLSQTMLLGLRGLFRKRGRAILTLLALTLSGAVFMAVQTTTTSIESTMGVVFNTYNEDVNVGINPVSSEQVKTIVMSVPNVVHVESVSRQIVTTQWGSVLFTALEPDTQAYRHQVTAGRWFSKNDVDSIIISDVTASKTHLHVGDSLAFSTATNSATWHIIGIVHDLNQGVGNIGSAITTIKNFNAFNGRPADLASSLMVVARDRSNQSVDQLANRLDARLTSAGLAPYIETQQQNIQANESLFQIIYILFYAVAVIVAMVGILGLFNTLSASVLERRREIGILRSMGATSWRVAGVFWIEGIALALIAWGVGVILGIPGAYGFVQLLSVLLTPIDFAFNPLAFVSMLGVILLIATLSSFGPVLAATRVRIVDTLRYE